ncbi:hypothetical protein M3Y98_00479600 [Aphelenchoides besseyi]|nr:hypothetical protein M3Y98_00479600 [Aphelenchoides besseyi]KAI6192625.1 hypothetical protein M3Y96_01246900 [Aphelenchoides besseyi]
MPLLRIETNLSAGEIPDDFNSKITGKLAEWLNKPRKIVLVSVSPDRILTMGGTNEPAAHVELRAIGGIRGQMTENLIVELTNFVSTELKIAVDRFIIHLYDSDPELVGFNGQQRSKAIQKP